MAAPKVSITLNKSSYLHGEEAVGTLTGKDPARFYTWGWGVSDAGGGGLGEVDNSVAAGQTTISVVPNTYYSVQRYGQASFQMHVNEWTAQPPAQPTYTEPTYVGTVYAAAIYYKNTTVLPTIASAGLSEGNPKVTAAAIGGYVQGVSQLNWNIDASSPSNITSYEITIDGTVYRSQSGTSGVLATSGSKTITTKVTDGAGNVQTRTDTINVLAYAPPKITAFTAFRATSGGVENLTGTYVRMSFTGTASSLVVGTQKNSTSYVVKSRPLGGAYTDHASGTSNLAPTWTGTPAGFAVATSYEVRVTLSDKLSTVEAVTYISKGNIALDLGPNNAAVGKEWQRGTLDVGGDTFIDGTVTATGLDLGAGPVQAGSVDATSFTQDGNNVVDASLTATESRRGLIEIATQAEVDAGTDTTLAVTPSTLKSSLELPLPWVGNGSSAMSIASTGWAGVPGATRLEWPARPRDLLVDVTFGAEGSASAGYFMIGASIFNVAGTWSVAPEGPDPMLSTYTNVYGLYAPFASTTQQSHISGSKSVIVPAGVGAVFQLAMRKSTAGATATLNYASIEVRPVRWV